MWHLFSHLMFMQHGKYKRKIVIATIFTVLLIFLRKTTLTEYRNDLTLECHFLSMHILSNVCDPSCTLFWLYYWSVMFYTRKLDKKHIFLCTFNKLILWCELVQLWLKNMLPKQNLQFNCCCQIIII